MKVICAGYWKTGTKSLAGALKSLGYQVYDYDDQFFELGELWDKFHNGTVTDDDIYESLKDIDVLIDGPVVAFWEEIHKVFPESRIILSLRDEDGWYKSYQGMYDAIPLYKYIMFAICSFLPSGRAFNRRLASLIRFCDGVDGMFRMWPSDNPRLHKLKFRKHNSYVLQCAPKDKLLVHRSADGWKPLCEFLEKEIPDGQVYPHLNKEGAHMTTEAGPQNKQYKKLEREVRILIFVLSVILACVLYFFLFV